MKNQQERQQRQAYLEALQKQQEELLRQQQAEGIQTQGEDVQTQNDASQQQENKPPDKNTKEEEVQEQAKEQEEGQVEGQAKEQVQEQAKEQVEKDNPEEEEDESWIIELYAKLIGKKINENGKVVDKKTGAVIGKVVEGRLKRLVGKKVRENGQVFSSKGKLIGYVDPIINNEEEESECNEDSAAVQDIDIGKRNDVILDDNAPVVRKSGKIIDKDRNVIGMIDKQLASQFVGFKMDKEGHIINDKGDIVAKAELVKDHHPYIVEEDWPVVRKSGKVLDLDDNVVGHVEKSLAPELAGFKVDPAGNVVDHKGHIVAKAQMMQYTKVDESSPVVRKSGKVLDINDNVVGKVDKNLARKFAGFKVDGNNGYIVNHYGDVVGKAEMFTSKEKDAPSLNHENSIDTKNNTTCVDGITETNEQSHAKQDDSKDIESNEDDEYCKIADQMSTVIQESNEKIKPVLDSINKEIETKENTDEETLINILKPLIEQGSNILEETTEAIRNLDLKARLVKKSQNRVNRIEGITPEENRLATVLAQLSGDVITTIDKSKKRIKKMPHVKKELESEWNSLQTPLLQTLSIVGLLFMDVLVVAGHMLNDRGLGSVVNTLLGAAGFL